MGSYFQLGLRQEAMIKRILISIIVVAIIAGCLLLITYLVPDINQFATDLAKQRALPFWLIGLIAPIAFILRKSRDWFAKLFKFSNTEKEIKELDDWRNEQLTVERSKYTTTINEITEIDNKILNIMNELKAVRENNNSVQNDKTINEIVQRINNQLIDRGY